MLTNAAQARTFQHHTGMAHVADRQSNSVALLSLATAVPKTILSQDEATRFARRLFGNHAGLFDQLAGVFQNTGIAKRHIVRPPEWYEGDHGWSARNQVYLESAEELYIEAARKALDQAGVRAEEVDTLVTVSTTGIATPSLEARVAGRMGFRQDAERVPVFGLGCAGGVSGLALASRLAASGPDRVVLSVTIELCTISIRLDRPCSGTVLPPASCAAAEAAWPPSRAAARSCGRIRSISWAGPSMIQAWAWCSTDPFRRSSRNIWPKP